MRGILGVVLSACLLVGCGGGEPDVEAQPSPPEAAASQSGEAELKHVATCGTETCSASATVCCYDYWGYPHCPDSNYCWE